MTSMRRAIACVFFGFSAAILAGCDPQGSSSSADGNAALPVSSSASSSVTISWAPPDTNANGSALTDLAGYRIYYGTDSTALQKRIDIPTSGLTDYVIQDLDPHTTYYFAMSTLNSAGVESAHSAVVSVTIS